jgi:flagellar hook-associated protein 3 FlgL
MHPTLPQSDRKCNKQVSAYAALPGGTLTEKTQLTVAQTNLMQADVAQLATRLSLAETQRTALESVIVQLSSASNSLFSKL